MAVQIVAYEVRVAALAPNRRLLKPMKRQYPTSEQMERFYSIWKKRSTTPVLLSNNTRAW